jgi:DNA-binding Lrp family transcriptional regulator
MIKAFVMATVGTTEYLGLVKTVKEEIAKMPGVLNVYTVFGRYDLIVEVEAKDLSELSRLVDDRIRAVSGVLSTETFVCYEPV